MVINFDGKQYSLDVDEIDVAQAMVIKVKTGFNLLQWQAALEEGDVLAVKALYWLMLAQNGIASDIDLVNFKLVRFIEAVGEASKADKKDAEPNPT
jgi:hypothetical protein